MNDVSPRKLGTEHPEIFAALARVFPREEVKELPKGGKKLLYITARTAMNRLDEVLGNENWWDAYTPGNDSVTCALSIRLPDGRIVTKCDAGGYAGMSDQGDDDKSGFSDAFKRAAVKFGVGRYLYRDGVPRFEAPTGHHAKNHDNQSGHGIGAYADPGTVKAYDVSLAAFVDAFNKRAADRLTGPHGEMPDSTEPLLRTYQVTGHMLKWAIREGLVKAPEDFRPGQREKFAALVWSRHRERFNAEANRYGAEKLHEARVSLGLEDGAEATTTQADASDDIETDTDSEAWPAGRE